MDINNAIISVTSLIPLSGLIVFALSVIAFIKAWGTWYVWAVVISVLIAGNATNALAKGDGSLMAASIWQDVQCVIAVYGIWWLK